ncbi:MAG: type 2 lanthipeptide synthetase LanM [Bacillota bacterium]
MKYISIDIRDIIERSGNLFERVDASTFECIEANEAAEKRLNNWCQSAAEGAWESFEHRLSKLGLTRDTAKSLLGEARLKPNAPIPEWAKVLEEIIGYYESKQFDDSMGVFLNDEPIAFQELFLPFIYWAENRLAYLKSKHSDLVDDAVYTALERALLKDLSQLCTRVLEMEFTVYRSTRQSPLDRFLIKSDELPNELYMEFISNMQQGGFLELLKEYPVLARLSATLAMLWLESIIELLERLNDDVEDISELLNEGKSVDRLVSIEPNMSDRHHSGRTVAALTFEAGLKLIYKPKSLEMEKTYFEILEWINNELQKPVYKVLKVLNKQNHGWIEFVEHIECTNEAEIEQYYEKAGALLAILHILRASDCHVENIIASGTYPVLVDAECLLHPYSIEYKKGGWGSVSEEEREKTKSVLRTGLLPGQTFTRGDVTIGISGFGTITNQGKTLPELKWDKVNTDYMSYGYFPVKSKHNNLPVLNGIPQYPEQYVAAITRGFEHICRFFTVYNDNAPMQKLINIATRFVYRPTRTYMGLLTKTMEPKYLRNGIDRSIELDALSRYTFSLDEDKGVWELQTKELKALEQLDVPYLSTKVTAYDNFNLLNQVDIIMNAYSQ